MKKFSLVMFLLLAAGLIATVMFRDQEPRTIEDTDGRLKIRAGYLAIAGGLPVFVADQEGFFVDEGLDVELVQFRSSNEIAIAAANGQIDFIALGATNAVLDAGATSDTEFLAFQLNGYTSGENGTPPTDYLLAREGITLENLKGKKVAFFPGSISRVFGELVFPKFGLELQDVEYIEMAPPNWQSALASGAIDAVTAIEPFATQIIFDGDARPIISGYYAQAMSDVPLSAAWFVKDRLNTSVELKIVAAFENALAFINESPDSAVQHYQAFTTIRPAIFTKIGLNNWRLVSDKDARKSMLDFIQLLSDKQEIKKVYGEIIWEKGN